MANIPTDEELVTNLIDKTLEWAYDKVTATKAWTEFDDARNSLRIRLRELREKRDSWIPVAELPLEDDLYDVIFANPDYVNGDGSIAGQEWYFKTNGWSTDREILYYRKIPNPPESVKQEKP